MDAAMARNRNERSIADLKYIEYLLGLGETNLEFVNNVLEKKASHLSGVLEYNKLIKRLTAKYDYIYRTKELNPLFSILNFMKYVLHNVEALVGENKTIVQCKSILHTLEEKIDEENR